VLPRRASAGCCRTRHMKYIKIKVATPALVGEGKKQVGVWACQSHISLFFSLSHPPPTNHWQHEEQHQLQFRTHSTGCVFVASMLVRKRKRKESSFCRLPSKSRSTSKERGQDAPPCPHMFHLPLLPGKLVMCKRLGNEMLLKLLLPGKVIFTCTQVRGNKGLQRRQ
jgi:hypothetical protein